MRWLIAFILFIQLTGCKKMGMIQVLTRMANNGVADSIPTPPASFNNSNLVFDGNSWTNYGLPCFAGESYGPGAKYPDQLLALSPWNINGSTINNRATSGQTTAQMISGGALACHAGGSGTRGTAEAYIDSQLISGRRNILIVWEVGNDLFFVGNTTGAYNRIVQYCNDRRAAGWEVVVLTPLYRVYGAGPTPAGDSWTVYNSKIDSVCASMRSNWASFADAICDVNARSEFSDPTDTDYFIDGVHPNGTGRGIVANMVSTAIQSIAS